MSLVSSRTYSNNHKIYFSKNELTKILNTYSKGVSRGYWKDYAINFSKNDALFFIFNHSFASPECILSKSYEKKRNIFFYKITSKNFNKKFEDLDNLIKTLNRKSIKLV